MFGLELLSVAFPLLGALAGGGGLWTKCMTFPFTSKKNFNEQEKFYKLKKKPNNYLHNQSISFHPVILFHEK